MKCLMIKPEYLSQIMAGEKDVEYRTWSTNYRGDILLGCSSTRYSNSYVAGVATLTDCYFDASQNVFCWVLDDIRVIKPIKVTGKVRLFDTDIEDYEELDSEEDVDKAYDEATWIAK